VRRLHAAALAFVTAIAVTTASGNAAVVTERPEILEPSGRVNLPIVFSWSPLSGGNVPVVAAGGRRRSAVLPAPSYELQISDRADVGSNVLVDVTTTTTSYFFTNNFPATVFTTRADGPLAGGIYYFRVRAHFAADTDSEFSATGSFTLDSASGTAAAGIHVYAIIDIAPVGKLIAGTAGTVVVRVRNEGTFAENSGFVTLTYDGVRAGRAAVPPLAPGESALLEYPVAPTAAGMAELDARLTFADQSARRNALSKTVEVRAASATITSLHGRIRRDEQGFVFVDLGGRVRADLVPGAIDLARYAGQLVTVSGALTTGKRRFTLTVRSVVPDPGVK